MFFECSKTGDKICHKLMTLIFVVSFVSGLILFIIGDDNENKICVIVGVILLIPASLLMAMISGLLLILIVFVIFMILGTIFLGIILAIIFIVISPCILIYLLILYLDFLHDPEKTYLISK